MRPLRHPVHPAEARRVSHVRPRLPRPRPARYFSSKYEAICAIGTDRARRIGAELLARPTGEPLWEAIVFAMLAHYEGAGRAPDGEWMARLKLVLAAPAIRGEYLKVTSDMREAE